MPSKTSSGKLCASWLSLEMVNALRTLSAKNKHGISWHIRVACIQYLKDNGFSLSEYNPTQGTRTDLLGEPKSSRNPEYMRDAQRRSRAKKRAEEEEARIEQEVQARLQAHIEQEAEARINARIEEKVRDHIARQLSQISTPKDPKPHRRQQWDTPETA